MSASVENFYWILYENLLKPVGMDCRFEYPFGSKHILRLPFDSPLVLNRTIEEKRDDPRNTNGALLHFDQEPIYEEDDAIIYTGTDGNIYKNLRLLANSEKSDLKKKFCRRYLLGDWYYFYHGFAALDWYRDAEYIDTEHGIVDAFSSFNHIIMNKRSYRMSLMARLVEKRIVDRGTVSFHGSAQNCIDEFLDPHTQISDRSKALIEQQLIQKNIQSIVVDSHAVDGTYSAKFGGNLYRMRQRSFLHLVNETVFYDRKLHLTEKTFHPIVHLRPFMLVAAPGNLNYLRSYGFKTFSDWIDESYDEIEDDDERLDHIADETERIASKSVSDLTKMLEEMRPVLEFNKQHFFGRFREIISNELVDNFETCLRVWNNGRVDGRDIPILDSGHLRHVKRLLSR